MAVGELRGPGIYYADWESEQKYRLKAGHDIEFRGKHMSRKTLGSHLKVRLSILKPVPGIDP